MKTSKQKKDAKFHKGYTLGALTQFFSLNPGGNIENMQVHHTAINVAIRTCLLEGKSIIIQPCLGTYDYFTISMQDIMENKSPNISVGVELSESINTLNELHKITLDLEKTIKNLESGS